MEKFILEGYGNFLKITLAEVFDFPEKTSSLRGYDTKSTLEISSGDFQCNFIIYISMDDILKFYKELYEANKSLSGSISFTNIYDRNLEFSINYDVNGQVLITGIISSTTDFGNSLNFEFMSDQSYIQSTLIELDIIAKKYGDKRN